MPSRFLDTNILLRYFTKDDEEKAQKALALLKERGATEIYSWDTDFDKIGGISRFEPEE